MENKKIQIKNDDVFHVLSIATGKTYQVLENLIFTSLMNEGVMDGDVQDAGLNLMFVAEQSGYSIEDIMEIVFPDLLGNTEVSEMLMAVTFWGLEENGCPDCGCEVETTEDGSDGVTWLEFECTNCEYKSTDEPDWDCLPGGKDYR